VGIQHHKQVTSSNLHVSTYIKFAIATLLKRFVPPDPFAVVVQLPSFVTYLHDFHLPVVSLLPP
jgi:hypothetical protein